MGTSVTAAERKVPWRGLGTESFQQMPSSGRLSGTMTSGKKHTEAGSLARDPPRGWSPALPAALRYALSSGPLFPNQSRSEPGPGWGRGAQRWDRRREIWQDSVLRATGCGSPRLVGRDRGGGGALSWPWEGLVREGFSEEEAGELSLKDEDSSRWKAGNVSQVVGMGGANVGREGSSKQVGGTQVAGGGCSGRGSRPRRAKGSGCYPEHRGGWQERRGPHMVAGARKDAPLCSASWALTSCILESGACRGSRR